MVGSLENESWVQPAVRKVLAGRPLSLCADASFLHVQGPDDIHLFIQQTAIKDLLYVKCWGFGDLRGIAPILKEFRLATESESVLTQCN